jgi:HlyD family secretion protein
VQVRLTAYGTKQLPPLDGTLTYVAADQSVDERTSAAYYVVRAAVADSALPKSPKITLNAGEPADLMILNRPRLAIDYIVSPFTDSMHKAFHEE